MIPRILLLLFLLKPAISVTSKCPQDCICDLDDPVGRIRVTCNKGGLVGPLDLSEVSLETEVLIYTAPEDNMNSLMIGPIFGSLKHIQEIHITRSNIPEIGEHSFWLLKTLDVLNLRENNISTILGENFRGCVNLKELYLDENRIDRLSSGSFKYMEFLRVLSLSHNRLEELVTRVFEKLTRLQELNLNGNRLVELNPEAFIDIQGLKILQCRGCGLKTINNDFFHLIPDLQILDFGENDFKYIASDDFINLPNLKSLWLDVNKITAIPQKAFSSQTELKKLNLARNRINLIGNTAFGNVTSLMELNLADNSLKEMDDELMVPFGESLQRLELGGNDISILEVKACLKPLKRIQHVRLNDMNLSELPLGLFDFNRDLSSLSLAGNYFVFFPIGAFSPVPKLKDLDFSRNKLKGLDRPSLQRIESIENVKFHANPWSCDLCHIIPMLEKMNTTTFLQHIVCKSPYYLKGTKLGDLEFDSLRKCTTGEGLSSVFIQEGRLEVIAAGAGLLLLLLTLISLLAGVCYTRRHARAYYTHEEKRNLEHDPICETTDLVFIENGEINFKFPLEKKISIATIEDIKKDPDIQANGT